MLDSLVLTAIVLAIEVALFVLCVIQVRRPVNLMKPRLLPYNLIMIFLALAIMATLAHIISLYTGHQLMPRQRKGLR